MSENNKNETSSYSKNKSSSYLVMLALVLALFTAYNLSVVSDANKTVDAKVNLAKDAAKPASIEITTIFTQSAESYDVSGIIAAIKQLKANVAENTLDYESADAKAIIKKYNITRIPTIIIEGETEKAGLTANTWSSIGTQESDGSLVLRVGAPFTDPASGKVIGKAELVLLNDTACKSCYDVAVHRTILNASQMSLSGERIIGTDSAEGRALIAKYNITKVPTMLISPGAKYYDFPTGAFGGGSLQDIWKTIGTIESDGWYVFRNMDAMRGAVYFDIAQNKIINQTKA